jgi:hypothetical protein
MKSESVTDWTLEQAAEHLGKSVKTIRRMLQAESLKGYKVQGPRGEEWRVKPINVSDLESSTEGSDSPAEDDRLCQLLAKMDGKIEDLVTRTVHLEALFSETQKRAEQADRERMETQSTLEHTNKQLAQMSELLHAANKERDATIREASEMKGQVQTLTTQVSDLMSNLACHPVQEPIAAAQETPAAEEPVLPEQTQTVKLILHVKAKNAMQCPIGHPMQSRENIEKAVLSRFGMKKLSDKQGPWESTGEYELVFSDAGLDQQIADLCRECNQEASKLKCSAKCEIKS